MKWHGIRGVVVFNCFKATIDHVSDFPKTSHAEISYVAVLQVSGHINVGNYTYYCHFIVSQLLTNWKKWGTLVFYYIQSVSLLGLIKCVQGVCWYSSIKLNLSHHILEHYQTMMLARISFDDVRQCLTEANRVLDMEFYLECGLEQWNDKDLSDFWGLYVLQPWTQQCKHLSFRGKWPACKCALLRIKSVWHDSRIHIQRWGIV